MFFVLIVRINNCLAVSPKCSTKSPKCTCPSLHMHEFVSSGGLYSVSGSSTFRLRDDDISGEKGPLITMCERFVRVRADLKLPAGLVTNVWLVCARLTYIISSQPSSR